MVTHEVVHEVYYDGVWNEVSTEVHEPSNTSIERGFSQFADPKPAQIEWTFEDAESTWVPDNPMSPLYGQIGRAMPCRVTVDGSVRAYAEAALFSPDRSTGYDESTPGIGRQWTDMRADGVLARIASWEEPLRSPMYTTVSSRSTLVGHWPMEEGRDATQLSNTVPGGAPGTVRGVEFGNSDHPDGAAGAMQLTEPAGASKVGGTFKVSSTTAGWQFAWSLKLPALPGGTTLQLMSWRTSNGYHWVLNTLTNIYQFKVVDSTGALLKEVNVGFSGSGEPNQWVTFRMKASESGGTVNAEFAWYVQGQTTPYGTNGTFTGTLGRLVSWSANSNTYMEDALLSHVFGVTGGTDDLLGYAARRAFDGYVGELAADRFERLMAAAGLDYSVIGTAADSMPMGRQFPDTLYKNLQEIGITERGLIYDSRSANRVDFRLRTDLYEQTPVAFTYTDLAPPFRERYDYIGVANRVTVSQRDGGEATATLESGPMSVQPIPDGIGEKKGTLDVNVSDEALLADLAGWELANGTIPGARFPSVTFDLDSAAGQAVEAAVTGIDMGDLITIGEFRYNLLYLLVIGIEETSRQKSDRRITFTCIPGQAYAAINVYDADGARYDSASTTLKTAVNSSATTLVFRTQDINDLWSTTEEPYDIMVSGERVTVTSMGAASLVSGAYDQSATVTRAVNGVTKSLPAGAEIHAFDYVLWAL